MREKESRGENTNIRKTPLGGQGNQESNLSGHNLADQLRSNNAKAALYGVLKDRYWSWLKDKWKEIDDYSNARSGNSSLTLHPSYGTGTTRYTDATSFTREFEKYLDTPDSIRNAALAIDELRENNFQDFQTLQLIVYGKLPTTRGSRSVPVEGASQARKKRKRIFNYLFSHLPEDFIKPLTGAEIIGPESQKSKKSQELREPKPKLQEFREPRPLDSIKEELKQLYQPDFLPWMLRLDNMREHPDDDAFEAAWPIDTEEGKRMRQFGRLLNRYKKRGRFNSYGDTLKELDFATD